MARPSPPNSERDDQLVELPVRRRVGRRLAIWAAAAATVLGVLVLVAVRPWQEAEARRIAADHISLLAEAVAASYEQQATTTAPAHAEDIEGEAAVDRQHTQRVNEVLAQLQRADSIVAIDIVDHAGVVRRSTRPARVGGREDAPSRLRRSEIVDDALVVAYGIPNTTSCRGCHADAGEWVGAVNVVVDKATVFASLEHYRVLLGFILLGTYVVLVVLLVALAERFVGRPAFALARLMRQAERGDFLVRARVEGDDELGALAMAFNRMLRSITALKADEVEREARLHAAEAELQMKQELAAVAERLQQSNAALERRVRAQELLMLAAHRLGSTLERGALLERLARVLNDKFGRPDFVVYLIVEGESHEVWLEAANTSGALDRQDVRSRRFSVGEGITGLVAETGAPLLIDDLRDPFARTAVPPAVMTPPLIAEGSLVAVPMLHKGRVVGVFEFYDPQRGAFDDEDLKLLEALAAQAAMAVVNADLYQRTLELAVTDTLTGLMNRRALNRLLEAELERARRFGTPLTVLMLDVDHFKQYNDRMGHLLGDDALRAVAQALQRSVRKVDAVARFGGEEFCVVLPRTDIDAGLEVTEKLLRAVRALVVPGADAQPLGHMSISVGVAVYPLDLPPVLDEEGATTALIDAADRGAYEAKRAGRDRVHLPPSARSRRPRVDEPGPRERVAGADTDR
ncbi:MAG: diguanylate cyclase [Deltaproteobacteria bacterium]|nr:diguanylate cyclase [Deltaproteobacteria bacterium]